MSKCVLETVGLYSSNLYNCYQQFLLSLLSKEVYWSSQQKQSTERQTLLIYCIWVYFSYPSCDYIESAMYSIIKIIISAIDLYICKAFDKNWRWGIVYKISS